jgi:hypothetical protein
MVVTVHGRVFSFTKETIDHMKHTEKLSEAA